MVALKGSGKISKLKKGDTIKIDGKVYEVDGHYVLIDHGTTKEMTIEVFDPKAKEGEGEGQLRYFDDRAEESIQFYVLKSIMYEEQEIKKVEW